MKRIQGVILDLDGTFLDSNDSRAEAWAEAFHEANHPITVADTRPLVGMVAHDLLSRLVGFGEDTEEGRKIRDRARSIFVRRYVPRLVPTYRAEGLLKRIEDNGTKVAVVSVDPAEVLLPLLKLLGAEGLIHRASFPPAEGIVTTRDLLKAAADRIGTPLSRTALIADAPHDVDAGTKLGLTVVALASGGFSAASLKGAAEIHAHAQALLHDFDHSVLAAAERAA
ncbi:MAG: HAD hydrolase-like protein [Myxococcota bacterium]